MGTRDSLAKRRDAIVSRLTAERDEALTRAAAAERERDRWRHGVPIEGDYACPDSLRADAAEHERDEARRERDEARTERDRANAALAEQCCLAMAAQGVEMEVRRVLACPAGDIVARVEAVMRVVALADEFSRTDASPLALFEAVDALRTLSTTGDQP